MKGKETHITEDQVLQALVDEKDLPNDTRRHLAACTICQEKKDTFLVEMERLGELARELTPQPARRPELPVRTSHSRRFRWPLFAAGFAMVLFLVFIVSLRLVTDSPREIRALQSTNREIRLFFVDEILEEPILPEAYLPIAVSSNGYFDDEFMEFLIPVVEMEESFLQVL